MITNKWMIFYKTHKEIMEKNIGKPKSSLDKKQSENKKQSKNENKEVKNV